MIGGQDELRAVALVKDEVIAPVAVGPDVGAGVVTWVIIAGIGVAIAGVIVWRWRVWVIGLGWPERSFRIMARRCGLSAGERTIIRRMAAALGTIGEGAERRQRVPAAGLLLSEAAMMAGAERLKGAIDRAQVERVRVQVFGVGGLEG